MKINLSMLLLCFSFSSWACPYEPNVAWDKQSVEVCWGTKSHKRQTFAVRFNLDFVPYTTEQKKWIQEFVTKEYTIKDVGIEFTGWKDCSDPVSADVVLFRTHPDIDTSKRAFLMSGGQATIGQKSWPLPVYDKLTGESSESFEKFQSPLVNFLILNTVDPGGLKVTQDEYLKIIGLHEFGHTAGLAHAHSRLEEAKNDRNCKRTPDMNLTDQGLYSSTKFSASYDYNSIMNYCFINRLKSVTGLQFRTKGLDDLIKLTDPTLYTVKPVNEKKQDYTVRIGLSEADKTAIRCMYVYDEQMKKERCDVRR